MSHVEPIHLLSADLGIEKRIKTYAWHTSIEELIDMYEYGQLVIPDEYKERSIIIKPEFTKALIEGRVTIPYMWVSLRRREGKWVLEKGIELFLIIIDEVSLNGKSKFKNKKCYVDKIEEEWVTILYFY
jgi:hypothetical protein